MLPFPPRTPDLLSTQGRGPSIRSLSVAQSRNLVERLPGLGFKYRWFALLLSTSMLACLAFASSRELRSVLAESEPGAETQQAANPNTTAVVQISLASSDLAYNPSNQTIYASVPANAPNFANNLVTINATNGALGAAIAIGNNPGKLAISDDGQYLYASLEGSGSVRRFDIPTQTLGPEFSLGTYLGYTVFARDMQVMPGSPETLAIARATGGISHGLVIFDNGIPRPNIIGDSGYTDVIAFGANASILYSLNQSNSGADFRKLAVDGGGVFEVNYTRHAGRVFFLVDNFNGTASIRAYDRQTSALTGTMTIPGISGNIASFIRWGTNGFAFRTTSTVQNQGNQLFIIESSLVPPAFNPIDDARTFVRQHYLDFLSREPEPGGWDYWTYQITQCGSDTLCIHNRRIDVSAAFFIAAEFQETGYVVYRMYRAAYGTWPNAPTRVNLSYAQFSADRPLLVGGAGLPQNTIDFANNFVQRPEFAQAYPGAMTNAEFVNRLFDTASLFPFTAERQQEIDAMNNNGRTRAQVLLNVINIQAFRDREYDPAFVLMQYFGYLRRDPEQGGYDYWLYVLTHGAAGNYRGMVCAFITSGEYQLRFGSAITRSNQDCQ